MTKIRNIKDTFRILAKNLQIDDAQSGKWIFALPGLMALGIVLMTVSWQSWRAATRNPVEALRYE